MHGASLRQALRLKLLVVLVVTLSACGAFVSKPLPEEEQELRPGVYHTEEFKPSFSFRVGEGWSNEPPEVYDVLLLTRGHDVGGLGFANLEGATFYEVDETGASYATDVPKDLVAWFRHHPYLRTFEAEPVTIGGVEGVRLDMVVEDLPHDYRGLCGSDCVGLFRSATDWPIVGLFEQDKARLIVLEDVKGETVLMGFVSPASKFEEHAPEAQKVIDTVEWTDT